MFPYFILFGKTISTYMLAALVGIFASGIFVYAYSKKKGIDEIEMIVMMLVAAVGGLIGSHILYGLVNFNYIIILIDNFEKVTSFSMFIDCLKEIFGGAVFYGGLIGGLIAGYIYAKNKKLDIGKYSDIAAVSIPLMHCFGRIGCFLGGCCYGVESHLGFTYTHSLIEEANGISRFPIQLLEALLNLILFFILFYILKKSLCAGKIIFIYLFTYPVIRFTLEFWRGDSIRGFIFGLSTSQFISIFIFIFAIIMFIYKTRANNISKTQKQPLR